MRTKAKGETMKITSTGGVGPMAGPVPAAIDQPAAATTASPALQAAALESELLKPAQAALAELPEIDQDKVAALREALAKGEIRFDADRLAQLIQRYHGGR
jgi:negative regulator of flagellin synthesis FlgM